MNSIVTCWHNQGWKQDPNGTVHAQGAAYKDGQLLSGAALAGSLRQIRGGVSEWLKALEEYNGFFAIAFQAEDRTVVAVDRVRSIPIFYSHKGARIYISDNAEWLRREVGDEEMDAVAQDEFHLTGYVTGADTLFPNIKQLQAGEVLFATRDARGVSLEIHRYYRFLHSEPASYDEPETRRELERVATSSIQRLIDYASGRQIVVPLSGGYDSRLIVTLLKRLSYANILTFTYGRSDSKESRYSKRVADALGVPWHFVEYSANKWQRAWHTKERLEYQHSASGWASLPHVQDWLAVRDLKMAGAVAPDAVFCPGHSGDFVAGSHIPDDARPGQAADAEKLVGSVLRKHFSLTPWSKIANHSLGFWAQRILDRVEPRAIHTGEALADAFEKWDWQERQAKFIVNSVRVYEFYGYDWWLPLWDAEFVRYWEGVPLELRSKRNWYTSYVQNAYTRYIGKDEQLTNASDASLPFMFARHILKCLGPGVFRSARSLYQSHVHKHLSRKRMTSHILNPYHRFDPVVTEKLVREGYELNGIEAYMFLQYFAPALSGEKATQLGSGAPN